MLTSSYGWVNGQMKVSFKYSLESTDRASDFIQLIFSCDLNEMSVPIFLEK